MGASVIVSLVLTVNAGKCRKTITEWKYSNGDEIIEKRVDEVDINDTQICVQVRFFWTYSSKSSVRVVL